VSKCRHGWSYASEDLWCHLCDLERSPTYQAAVATAHAAGFAEGIERAAKCAYEYLDSYEVGDEVHPQHVEDAIRALKLNPEDNQ
jgi:hypothetical protein